MAAQIIVEELERAFTAAGDGVDFLVIIAVFVDGIVGQMHEQLLLERYSSSAIKGCFIILQNKVEKLLKFRFVKGSRRA